MKLIGLMPVRNEDWVLGLSLRAALMWCDEVAVLLHACTDRSLEIVAEINSEKSTFCRALTVPRLQTVWEEMSHRQALLEAARRKGATHIAMVDADEILTGNLLPTIRETIAAQMPGVVLQLPWLALPRVVDRYLTSGVWGPGQQVSMAFRDEPAAHWALHGGRDFHHRNPMGIGRAFRTPYKPEHGGLMHLQFLSERRLRAKQALYKAVEVLRWPAPCSLEGKYCATQAELAERLNWMYGRAVYESDPEKYDSAPCPASWWAPYAYLMKYLDTGESVPADHHERRTWQEIELQRLIKEHGREKFAGLDLFGVV
jgi:hypothetical protein